MCHSKKAANLQMQGKDTSTNHWQPLCASPYSINWRLRASTARALFLKLPLDLQRARNRSCTHKATSIMSCKTEDQQIRSASTAPQCLNRPRLSPEYGGEVSSLPCAHRLECISLTLGMVQTDRGPSCRCSCSQCQWLWWRHGQPCRQRLSSKFGAGNTQFCL